MQTKKVRYFERVITLQDVPREKSLSLMISGCDKGCPYCGLPQFKRDIGKNVEDDIDLFMEQYGKNITCFIFVGGDDPDTMENLYKCLDYCHEKGYKTALFTGLETYDKGVLSHLDYIKTSRCDNKKGKICNPETNQRLYKVHDDGELEDITSLFWKKN